MLSFDYSGKHGINGANGTSGHCGFAGLPGQSGSDGRPGTNANSSTHIELVMRTNNSTKIILNELNQRTIYDNLVLGDENNKVNLIANGGHGGHGGCGGDGGRGGDGLPGHNATRGSCGTNGGNGGCGGNGGNGGDGGSAGDGGIINVNADHQDMDLFMLVEQVSYKGGNAGLGGKGGCGGAGGFGGRGGSSYSWSETQNGVTRSYTNPGGNNGMPGFPGRDGVAGRHGNPGRDGRFSFTIAGQQFSSCYNLRVERVCTVQSQDGIIEPGEELEVNAMDVVNIGGMHTPVAQRIALTLQNNEWVIFNPMNAVYIPQSLNIGGVFSIDQQNPLIFQIKDYNVTTSDKVFKSTAVVDYRARVERVNKEFKTVAEQTNNYTVRFPVEMSQVQLLRSITFREESPFAISVWNRSKEPIGFNTISQRLLNFRLILNDTKQTVEFTPKHIFDEDKFNRNNSDQGLRSRRQQNFINPQYTDDQNYIIEQDFMTCLGPGEKKIISGTIKLKDLNLPLYTNIRMQAKLDLGHYHKQNELFQNIQTRNFHIQLTEGHEHHQNSDFLLVFNCETPSIFIDSIKEFAQSFGTGVDLWNISNYQGFSWDYIGPIDKSLSTLYKNKVVIFLANEYQLINSDKTNAIKQIREAHIYKGIKDYKINTYILGPCNNYNEFWLTHPECDQNNSVEVGALEDQLYRQFTQDKKDQKQLDEVDPDEETKKALLGSYLMDCAYTYNYTTSISCCSSPSQDYVTSKAETVLKKIDSLNPCYNHVMTYNYKPEVVKKNTFSSDYHLGNITVIESLRKDCAQLIMRNRQQFNETMLDQVDRFCLIKLLPFVKKLEYLSRAMASVEQAKLVIQAIISDLCDEYLAYSKFNQNNKELQLNLTNWSSFQIFPFEESLKPKSSIRNTQQTQRGQVFNSDPGQNPQNNYVPPPFQSAPPMPPPPAFQQFNGQQPPNFVAQEGNFDYPSNNSINLEGQSKEFPQELVKEINVVERADKIEVNINVNQEFNNVQILNSQDQQVYLPPPQFIPTNTPQEFQTLQGEQVKPNAQEQQIAQNIKNYFIDYLIKLQVAFRKQLSFGQKCCCSITSKVNSHCCTIIEAVLIRRFGVPIDQIKQEQEAYAQDIKLKAKKDVFDVYHIPHKEMNFKNQKSQFIKQSNILLESQKYLVKDFPHSNFNKDDQVYIQDGSFIFFNETTQQVNAEKRLKKITTFEGQIVHEKD